MPFLFKRILNEQVNVFTGFLNGWMVDGWVYSFQGWKVFFTKSIVHIAKILISDN